MGTENEQGSVFSSIDDSLILAIGTAAPVWKMYSLACSKMLTLQTAEKHRAGHLYPLAITRNDVIHDFAKPSIACCSFRIEEWNGLPA